MRHGLTRSPAISCRSIRLTPPAWRCATSARNIDIVSAFQAYGQFITGDINEEIEEEVEEKFRGLGYFAFFEKGSLSLEELILRTRDAGDGPEKKIFNNAAQHYNHVHFWKWMKPQGGGDKIPGALKAKIDSDLGGYDKMRTDFVQAGLTQFGSGWCWLAVKDGKIIVTKTPNGENPLVQGAKPILGCDVWEHSYYIDHRNARPAYLKSFWENLINWDYVNEMFQAASK